jgi:hypothetical protein
MTYLPLKCFQTHGLIAESATETMGDPCQIIADNTGMDGGWYGCAIDTASVIRLKTKDIAKLNDGLPSHWRNRAKLNACTHLLIPLPILALPRTSHSWSILALAQVQALGQLRSVQQRYE